MILYLHGFDGAGWGLKSEYIAKHFNGKFFAPNYPVYDPDESIIFVKDFINEIKMDNPEEGKLLIVGASLGGFYANWFTQQFSYNSVLINPAMTPWITLKEYVGENINSKTNETYHFTDKMLEAMQKYAFDSDISRPPNQLVLLDKGDEYLNYTVAEKMFRDITQVITYENGSHRFDHMKQALSEILNLTK